MAIDSAALDELRRSFRGELLTTQDLGYEDARLVWNAMVVKRPTVIARCASTEDVAAALGFARRSGLEVAVRGGGHSVSGNSSTDGGIVIDLTLMRTVTVDADARTATVGGGALIRDLNGDTKIRARDDRWDGLAHGGGGTHTRWRVRLPVEEVRPRLRQPPRGRGRARRRKLGRRKRIERAGVVLGTPWRRRQLRDRHVVQLRLPPWNRRSLAKFTSWATMVTVLRAFRDLVFTRQDVVSDTYTGAVSRSWPGVDESLVGRPIVTIGFTITGPKLDDGDEIAARLRGVAPPLSESACRQPYLELQSSGDELSTPGSARRYWKSSVFSDLPDAVLDAFLERGIESASVSPDFGLEMLASFGGAVAQVGEDDTAFSHRHAQVDFLAIARWMDPSEDEDHIEQCRANWEAPRGSPTPVCM